MPGDRLPLYCTGVGKAILSQLSEDRMAAILGPYPLEKYTEFTCTDPDDIIKEVRRARELGYGIDSEEFEVGLTCYAMPLRIPSSDFVGAISISGPTARMKNPEIRDRFIYLLEQAIKDAIELLSPHYHLDIVSKKAKN
jgi:IclR family acetate operon transcriptional repressor